MSGRFGGLPSRGRFWKTLGPPWWGWAFLILWTLFNHTTVLRDYFLPDLWQQRLSVPEVLYFASEGEGQLWVIGLLLITLVIGSSIDYPQGEINARQYMTSGDAL